MIKNVRYKYEDFIVKKNSEILCISPKNPDYSIEQRELFTAMINFGYIEVDEGIFSITSKQIVDFWNYAKDTVLTKYSIEKFYEVLNLGDIYKEKIPGLKTTGSFYANDFVFTVVWSKTDSNMMVTPIAYKQEGLKLKELEFDETLGCIYPEYFELYEMIDTANLNWKTWNTKERYDFLEKIEHHSTKRKIIIPNNLMELLNMHKNNSFEESRCVLYATSI